MDRYVFIIKLFFQEEPLLNLTYKLRKIKKAAIDCIAYFQNNLYFHPGLFKEMPYL